MSREAKQEIVSIPDFYNMPPSLIVARIVRVVLLCSRNMHMYREQDHRLSRKMILLHIVRAKTTLIWSNFLEFIADLFRRFLIMSSTRREQDLNFTAMSNPERILQDSRRINAESSTAPIFRNWPTVIQSLEHTLQEVDASISSAEDQDELDSLADRFVYENARLEKSAYSFHLIRPAKGYRTTTDREYLRLCRGCYHATLWQCWPIHGIKTGNCSDGSVRNGDGASHTKSPTEFCLEKVGVAYPAQVGTWVPLCGGNGIKNYRCCHLHRSRGCLLKKTLKTPPWTGSKVGTAQKTS